MRKLIVLCSLPLLMTVSTFSFAAGYGAAGCGLGSIAFQGKSDKVSQVLAGTTNGTAGNQTFGITTGTSNCDSSGLVLASKEVDAYAMKNYDSLTKEMASGSGEHLATLAKLLGYDQAKMSEYSRSHYGEIFASENITSREMLAALVRGMDSLS
jgi:hypothetical protein